MYIYINGDQKLLRFIIIFKKFFILFDMIHINIKIYLNYISLKIKILS